MEIDTNIQGDLSSLSKEQLISIIESLRATNSTSSNPNTNTNTNTNNGTPSNTTNNKDTNNANNNSNKGKKKKQREFDMSRYCQRHVALKIAYLGWDYHGFAAQADSDNTIEHHIFSALQKTCLITSREESNYSRCGRTDKGVSAFGQVIGVHLRSNLTQGEGIVNPKETGTGGTKTEIQYAAILNRVLPPEIRVIAWTPVPPTFNARFSAKSRTYKYFFVGDGMDLAAMNESAKHLLGEHDFRNFCKMDVENVKNYKRVMLHVDVAVVSGNLCCITIQGYAFLWHQVRCMVAVLFMVGRHLEQPRVIADMLDIEKIKGKPMYEMASEIPLVLYDCAFENLNWIYEQDVLAKLRSHYQNRVHDLTIKSAVTNLMLESVVSQCTEAPPQSAHTPLLERVREDSYDERLARQESKKRRREEEQEQE